MGTPPPIHLDTLSMPDTLILMVLALVVFGPRRLPQIGRQVGKLMYELRKASNDFKFQMEEELRKADEYDRQKEEEARRLTLTAGTSDSAPGPVATPAPETAAAASADPYVDAYPAGTAETAQTAGNAPQIQPPSTGETVAAARPGSPAEESERADAPTPAMLNEPAPEPATSDTAPAAIENQVASEAVTVLDSQAQEAEAEKTAAATEPAAHHG